MSTNVNQTNDRFANIAAMGIQNKNKGLIIPQPLDLEETILPLQKKEKEAVFKPLHKMSTESELYEEVEKQKAYYRPFFSDLAPELPNHRIKKDLVNFQWRIGTEQDKKDFMRVLEGKGEWENLTVPHYGEPRGVATTYYRTTFEMTQEELDRGSLWICFKGVDYKAHVFVNGCFLGSHEGMFAPFEFDFSLSAHLGENTLVVAVENDYVCMGSSGAYQGDPFTGDKIYAATGLGYDDALSGWHHCPPGMGIYQDVYIEARERLFIKDIFVRPLVKEKKAEAWIELYSCDVEERDVLIELSLYGQNFKDVIFEKMLYTPQTYLTTGLGDSLTEAKVKAEGSLGKFLPLRMGRGINYLKIAFEIPQVRLWELESPWLYQLQTRIINEQKNYEDSQKVQFGMRSFEIREDTQPKGKFFFNDREIRLRGANTMGHEQQCVFKKDWEQLFNDLILAKVCHMNFLRITQRPVQPEIYDYCDKLGLMVQTDLPLFGSLRRNQFIEAVRQVEEMEHLIRPHASTILVSYINEPFPNAQNRPHRSLERKELEVFFKVADEVVHLLNPDRVIKRVDGDYDPPTEGLPDNHCYPCWYNGHGIDIGKLHKGYWMPVKAGWHYGCGEFGIEGLEDKKIMYRYYPKTWLPQEQEDEKNWSPNQIIGAQTGNFHYFFYETPETLEEWILESQKHQAQSITLMTNAYRRDSRMNTFAYHLFIDAFPSGWMKTIMDFERHPKLGFFAYREALTPLMVNIRTDRTKFFEKEKVKFEAWICNDTYQTFEDAYIHYQLEENEQIIFADKRKAVIPICSSKCQGLIECELPSVKERTVFTLRLALVLSTGQVYHDTSVALEIFPEISPLKADVCLIGESSSNTLNFIKELGLNLQVLENLKDNDTILVTDYAQFKACEALLLEKVQKGATLIFLELAEGSYEIAGKNIISKACGMLPLHFASRRTGHPLIVDFKPDDFKYWYDDQVDYITPIIDNTIEAEGASDILISGNTNSQGAWQKAQVAVTYSLGQGNIRICQIKLMNRISHNPIACQFAKRLMK